VHGLVYLVSDSEENLARAGNISTRFVKHRSSRCCTPLTPLPRGRAPPPWHSGGPLELDVEPLVHLQLERAIGAHVRVDQGCQRPQVDFGHPGSPRRLLEHALKHQRVDVDEARLQQVQGEDRDLLVLDAVRGDLAALAEEDEAVGAVPALDDIQAFVDPDFAERNLQLVPELSAARDRAVLSRVVARRARGRQSPASSVGKAPPPR